MQEKRNMYTKHTLQNNNNIIIFDVSTRTMPKYIIIITNKKMK